MRVSKICEYEEKSRKLQKFYAQILDFSILLKVNWFQYELTAASKNQLLKQKQTALL